MRPAIFALLLCASPAAICQSALPPQTQPPLPPLTLTLPTLPPALEFNQLPKELNFNRVVAHSTIVLPPTALQFKDRAQIDPQIIVHPPQSSLGEQPPGTLVAQNLYPGLQMLPIDQSRAKLEPIPISWPNFKMGQIPIDVSKGHAIFIEKNTTTQSPKK